MITGNTMTANELITRHLRITGKVQGVGYRAGVEQQAAKLRLTGWVRNRLDGSVEAVIQGPLAQVEAMIKWSHKGTFLARVREVLVSEDVECASAFSAFERRDTE